MMRRIIAAVRLSALVGRRATLDPDSRNHDELSDLASRLENDRSGLEKHPAAGVRTYNQIKRMITEEMPGDWTWPDNDDLIEYVWNNQKERRKAIGRKGSGKRGGMGGRRKERMKEEGKESGRGRKKIPVKCSSLCQKEGNEG